MYPKFYIGPMSKNIVDAIIEFCNETGNKIGLISSRRQIEWDGGYVNTWTTEQFSEYTKMKLVLKRDHAGPGQGYNDDDGYKSLEEDCKFFNLIHIDPWKKYPKYSEGLKWTIDMIKFCYNKNNSIEFEIGTEEAINKTKGKVPLAGNSHIYTVNKRLWSNDIEDVLQKRFIGKTIHICCGKSQLGDIRVDLDASHNPDIICDANDMSKFVKDNEFETALCDPPYNGKFQWNHNMLKELSRIASKRIIFQHWFIPATKDGYYKNGEAVEINNGFGKQLSYLKLKLEAYKLLKEIPSREELFLPKSKGGK